MSKVALVRCETYEYSKVKNAVAKGINLLGGVDKFAKDGEKILLKPSLLAGELPEKCVTTHPSVFKAVAEIFKSTGAKINYGDSPAIGSTFNAARKSGLVAVAEELNIEIAEFNDGREIVFEKGMQNKKFFIANAVLAADGIISLPKLKSHGFEKFTGSIKNQFGCIPGLLKGEFHVKLPDSYDFARMLVDLDRFIKPRLYIMDGIIGMDGNGPRGGNPKKMNILLFSEDPVALDATVCRLINLEPELVPTIKFGQEYNHGTYEKNKIELIGDDYDSFKQFDFVIDRSKIEASQKSGMMKFMQNRLVPKPVIDPNQCIKCGMCINICPARPKAVNWHNNDKTGPPVYNYSDCIRCYCCQEICPEKAITLKKPSLVSRTCARTILSIGVRNS
jgi:uncharacterized protein (DUF362 family)/NAD-dependent dihydropyrimidine dehydrogenase PreA subunit